MILNHPVVYRQTLPAMAVAKLTDIDKEKLVEAEVVGIDEGQFVSNYERVITRNEIGWSLLLTFWSTFLIRLLTYSWYVI